MSIFSSNFRVRTWINFLKRLNIRKVTLMADKVKISLLQLQSSSDKSENFNTCKDMIVESARNGVKMAFLPENFDFMCDNKQQKIDMSEPLDGELIGKYRQLAAENDIFLSLGGFHRKEASNSAKIFNTHVVIDNGGSIVARYDKIHLFDVKLATGESSTESSLVTAGADVVGPVATPLGPLGLAICYDVRFPELARRLRAMGASALSFPSAFTRRTGLAHWHTLLRARAIDNQCFVIAAAQDGQHGNRTSFGHSLVVDPWGVVLAERPQPGPGLLLCELDLDSVRSVRAQMPLLEHQRIDPIVATGTPIEIGSQSLQFGPHEISASCVFYRSALSFAFVNLSPLVPGHVLVSPVRLVARFAELSGPELIDLYSVVRALEGPLCAHYGGSGANISQQDGPVAGQSVPHVHVHVLPRKPGDFASHDEVHQQLNGGQSHQRVRRTEQEMAREARELRTLFYR